MLKKVVLILLLFSVVIAGGCSPPEPSLQDELREIDSDLQWAMADLEFAIEQCKKLERELDLVNTLYSDEAYELGKRLSELKEDIGSAQNRLSDIIR